LAAAAPGGAERATARALALVPLGAALAAATPAARACRAARMDALSDVAFPVVTGVTFPTAAAAAERTAAGWVGGSGAGSSLGAKRVTCVGRGDPVGTKPAGRRGPDKNVSPGRLGAACRDARVAGDGAMRGAVRSPLSTPRTGARALPCILADLEKPEMYFAIAARAAGDLSTKRRNSASRSVAVALRLRVILGRTAVTVAVLIVDDSLAHAKKMRSSSTTTPNGHGASLIACRGHHGKQSRNRLANIPPATAALPLTRAQRRCVRRLVDASSMARSNSLASDVGMWLAGAWCITGARRCQRCRFLGRPPTCFLFDFPAPRRVASDAPSEAGLEELLESPESPESSSSTSSPPSTGPAGRGAQPAAESDASPREKAPTPKETPPTPTTTPPPPKTAPLPTVAPTASPPAAASSACSASSLASNTAAAAA